jgi:hypothetical protein
MEQLLGTLKIRVTGCNVVEAELRKLREERQVRVQMRPEAVHAFKPRIDETERHHGGERDARVVKHGEFIHEIAVGKVALDSPGVAFVGQDFPVDSQLVAKERELLLLFSKDCLRYRCSRFFKKVYRNAGIRQIFLGVGNGLLSAFLSDRKDRWIDRSAQMVNAEATVESGLVLSEVV